MNLRSLGSAVLLTFVSSPFVVANGSAQAFEQPFRAGSELVLNGRFDDLQVIGVDEEVLSIRGGVEGRAFDVERHGDGVRVVTRRAGRGDDLVIRVPRSTHLRLESAAASVVLSGIQGGIDVEVRSGEVRVNDFAGPLRLLVLAGDIEVFDGAGPMTIDSGSSDVILQDVRGTLAVRGGTGDVEMFDVQLESMSVTTTSGDVRIERGLSAPGAYAVTSHSGDVELFLTEGATDLAVEITSFDGETEVGFPIALRRIRGGETQRLTIGIPNRTLVISTFSGDVTIARVRRFFE